jgi:type I restriction enzyme, S subunit
MTNTLPTYPTYKPSGIAWLGDVPEHWEVLSIKFVLAIPICDGPHTTPELHDDGYPFVSAEAIKNGEIDFNKIRGFISGKDFIAFSKKYSPKRNDIYMVKSGATTGNVAMVQTDREFSIWSPLAVFRAKQNKIISRYLLFSLDSPTFKTNVELNWSFGTQQNIGMGILSNLPICLPPLSEQTAIANFLDDKTAKIDTAIQIKQQQIQLLKERKQIIIHQAVTKGINPNAKMKDSGVEWIGEVPEGWEVKRLKYVADCFPSNIDKHSKPNEKQVRLCNYTDVYKNDFITNDLDLMIATATEDQIKKFRVLKGDIIITKDSETASDIAVPTYIIEDLENVVCGYHLAMIRTFEKNYAMYLYYALLTKAFNVQFEICSNGITRVGLGSTDLKKGWFLIPPPQQQNSIVTYIETATTKIATAISLKEQEIAKLKEYKSSLINDVVRGKVRVN